ncbi:MAG: PKD domain-containing protein, partial [Candidatus Aminicenantales bacterium]
ATFNDLSIDKAGSGYTLDATSSGLTTATSTSFDVTPGALASFAVDAPVSGTAGTPFSVTITAEDDSGNTTTSVSGATSLSVDSGSISPASIAESEFTDDGVWTGNITLTESGERTITATNSGKTGSDTITIEAGSASSLVFSQQPTDAVAGATIAPPVTVEVRDQWNNLCTSDSTTSVSIAINNNPGGGTLSGTTTQTASSGIATFNDLSIDKAGSGYTLEAASAGLTTAVSISFDITAGPAEKIRIEDQVDGTGTEIESRTLSSGERFTLYAISRDKYDNFVANVSATWSLIDKTRGIAEGDLVPSVDAKSAVFTAHGGGTARIKAQHPALGEDTTGLISVINQAPVANAGPDQEVNTGDHVQLDGSSSLDPDGDPLTYSWNFHKKPSQSQAALENSDTATPYFIADKGGEYIVRLIVSDGLVDSNADDVRIYANFPPIARFQFEPKSGFAPCKIRFDASSSSDPDGRIVSYEWDFGDGNTSSGVSTFHTYTSRGEFLVELKVIDNNGLSDTATSKVRIHDVFPPIHISLKREINRSLFRKEAFHTISWEYNPENNGLTIVSYRIYRKEAGKGDLSYRMVGTVPGSVFEYVDGYLDYTKKYVYVVTSVESSGHESKFSEPVGNR